METKLRTLQVRRDIIRTLNQRRLEGAKQIRVLGKDNVRGVVVKTGFHDEAGAAPWAVVRDKDQVEHYARLRSGQSTQIGKTVTLEPVGAGLAQIAKGRGSDLTR